MKAEQLLVVAYGMGVDSTAMLVGLLKIKGLGRGWSWEAQLQTSAPRAGCGD